MSSSRITGKRSHSTMTGSTATGVAAPPVATTTPLAPIMPPMPVTSVTRATSSSTFGPPPAHTSLATSSTSHSLTPMPSASPAAHTGSSSHTLSPLLPVTGGSGMSGSHALSPLSSTTPSPPSFALGFTPYLDSKEGRAGHYDYQGEFTVTPSASASSTSRPDMTGYVVQRVERRQTVHRRTASSTSAPTSAPMSDVEVANYTGLQQTTPSYIEAFPVSPGGTVAHADSFSQANMVPKKATSRERQNTAYLRNTTSGSTVQTGEALYYQTPASPKSFFPASEDVHEANGLSSWTSLPPLPPASSNRVDRSVEVSWGDPAKITPKDRTGDTWTHLIRNDAIVSSATSFSPRASSSSAMPPVSTSTTPASSTSGASTSSTSTGTSSGSVP